MTLSQSRDEKYFTRKYFSLNWQKIFEFYATPEVTLHAGILFPFKRRVAENYLRGKKFDMKIFLKVLTLMKLLKNAF